MYETFDHTADVGLRIRAATIDELFVDAARGLYSLLVANLNDIQPVEVRELSLASEAYDFLLFDWLAELLFAFEADRFVGCRFDVRVTSEGLTASITGESIDERRHRLEHEVKAITYHELRCEPTPDGWLAEVIVDI